MLVWITSKVCSYVMSATVRGSLTVMETVSKSTVIWTYVCIETGVKTRSLHILLHTQCLSCELQKLFSLPSQSLTCSRISVHYLPGLFAAFQSPNASSGIT